MARRVFEKEVQEQPPGSRAKLVGAWDKEIERRVARIQSGLEKGIPASQVLAGNGLARTRK